MNYAYVTLLSSKEYLPGVLVLNRNLKDLGCQYPLVVIVTNNAVLSVFQQLEAEGISYISVPSLSYSQKTIDDWGKDSTVVKTASKLYIFQLTQFDKIVYLDADSFFLKCPDELFEYYDGSMYDTNEDAAGFSGLMVCNPKLHFFEYYKLILQNSPGILDGDLFGTLWFPFKTNPDYRINYEWFIHIIELDKITYEDIKGIHFSYLYKPWYYTSVEEYIKVLNNWISQKENDNKYKVVKLYFNYLNILKQKFDNL